MARRKVVELIDDLDHRSPADETVTYTIDGVQFTLDLTRQHAAKLRADLQRWNEAASQKKRVGKPKSKRAPNMDGNGRANGNGAVNGNGRANGAGTTDIRAWARSQGLKVSDRGRIPESIQAAHQLAHQE